MRGENNYYTPTSHDCKSTRAGNKLLKALTTGSYSTDTYGTDHHKDTDTSADGMSVIMATGERKRRCGMYFMQEIKTKDSSCESVMLCQI